MADLFAPLHNPDFKEGASIDGDSVATLNDVADLRRFLLDLLGTRVQELVFNNGAVVPSGGTDNPVPVTDLNNKISIFMAPIRISYDDATYDEGVPIPIDTSSWTLASTPVLSADIRQASFTEKEFIHRIIAGPVGGPYSYSELVSRMELQADKTSFLMKWDLKMWMTNPADSAAGELFSDTRIVFSDVPDYTLADQTRLATVTSFIASKIPGTIIYTGAIRYTSTYYALAVRP